METGTPQAGLQAGDAFSLVPDHWHFVKAPWSFNDSPVLELTSTIGYMWTGHAFRYASAEERFEECRVVDGEHTWLPATRPALELGDVDSNPRRSSSPHPIAWRLCFLEDGPAVTTVRRFGPHLCVNPFVTWCSNDVASSTWTLVRSDGTLSALDVSEDLAATRARADVRAPLDVTAFSFRERPRPTPAELSWKPAAMRTLDPEIAKGIAVQMRDTLGPSWVGFDGVVRHLLPDFPMGAASRHRASDFQELTRGTFPKSDAERREAKAEYDATRAATIDEVGAVMRALFPLDWAREQQLAEECGVLARS
jgi:hypothetical protein